jgi:hypothetical protein
LHIDNNGVSSAVISVNGQQIFGPNDFNANVASLDHAVVLSASNVIQVELRGKPGESLAATIIGVDNDPPSIIETEVPSSNSFGWNNTNVNVGFTCSDATSGIASCPAPFLLTTQGLNQVVAGTAFDLAGNSATASIQISIDKTPPTIASSQTPAANVFGWNNTPVTVSFSCTDDLSGVASCPPNQTVSSQGANQTVSGTATDKAGNSASASAMVNLDETPPVISISAPADNSVVNASTLVVTGAANDTLSGVTTVTCNGVVASLQTGSFSCSVVLNQGANTIDIQATDTAGNSATVTRTVDFVSTGPLAFLSAPPGVAVVGKSLQHQVKAESPNPSTLSFFLIRAPAGMTIDLTSGLISWTPTPNQAGDQSVTVLAKDSTGQIFQNFTLSVIGSRVVASARVLAASGGIITVSDPTSKINGLSINIPANALPADTTIAISELSGSSMLAGSHRFLLKGFAIDPDGILLALPATVTVPYAVTEFDSSEGIPLEDFLGAYFLDTSTGDLQGLNTFSVDTTNHMITGTIPHFSAWEITNLARLCPPPTSTSDCPNTYSPLTPSGQLPAIMVHGFIFSLGPGFGDESTWGSLRSMLGQLNDEGKDRVDAWRFDYDSAHMWFEVSAGNLATAITFVKQKTGASLVNLVAHSFGGILVRTYLQDQANFGNPLFSARFYSNRNDVNRVMTLGTPHSGIGGDFSIGYANLCAGIAQIFPRTWITCFEASTGAGGGGLVNKLNSVALPDLQSKVMPQFDIVIGQLLTQDPAVGSAPPIPNDGLITTKGAAIDCSAGCPAGLKVETIATPDVDRVGLCHSGILFDKVINLLGCGSSEEGSSLNIAMAEINFPAHPMWPKVCLFLDSNADICQPKLTISLSDPAGGRVVTLNAGFPQPSINCGQTCSATYPAGTFIELKAIANPAAFFFSGWSGDCSGAGLAEIRMDADKNCTAIFSPLPIQIFSVTCTLTPLPQPPFASPFLETVKVEGVVTDLDIGAFWSMFFGTGLGDNLDCGNWSPIAIGTCRHNSGQATSTPWSRTMVGFFEEIPNPISVSLLNPSGSTVARASASYTCQ